MRITKLSIKKYKNLENFEWELNPDYPVAVIVGKNGSGKTNLLEVIIDIFQDLQLYDHESKRNKLPFYDFELHYLYGENNDEIIIKNNGKLIISKNGENVPLSRLQNFRQIISQGTEVLPKSIFVYYAGNTTRLEELCDRSIGQYKKTLIDIATNKVELQTLPKQPLFYYDLIHHRAVFLTLMLSNQPNIQDFLKNDLGIEELNRVSLEINRPAWNKSSNDEEIISDAPNYLRRILEIFNEIKDLGVEEVESKRQGMFFSGEKLKEAFTKTSNETDFFQQLSNLILADYLADIRIHFTKDGVEQLEFAELSEGEWQRIGIRGAMELFQGEETLFLLDEPDTFAHPRWQWEFVPDIKKTVGEDNKSMQAVFITHSPLVLSTVKDNDFMMMNGTISSIDKKLYGEKLEIVLSEMHGNSHKVEDDFKNYFELIEKGDGESPGALAIRKELEEKYGVNHSEIARADMWIAFYK